MWNPHLDPSLGNEFTLRARTMKVSGTKTLLYSNALNPLMVLDALPVSQMNPKKKIFETIQPSTSSSFFPFDHDMNAFLLT